MTPKTNQRQRELWPPPAWTLPDSVEEIAAGRPQPSTSPRNESRQARMRRLLTTGSRCQVPGRLPPRF